MKPIYFFSFFLLLIIQSCAQTENNKINNTAVIDSTLNVLNVSGNTIETRFNPPQNYHRIIINNNSFAYYLRNLPLKPHNSKVMYYDGSAKVSNGVYEAVVNLKIGDKDLHQCADAVMRLRAEYLFQQNKYDSIHFNFTNGFRVEYSKWIQGNRMVVNGNKTYWKLSAKPSNSADDLWNYLELIFTYAGTLSLAKELKQVNINDIQIGDVFIRGGSPGHAIIVVDMAVNENNKKVFILAQSYMPAQDLQILCNPNDKDLSPWYSIDFGDELVTPEWTFKKTELKRF